MSKESIVSLIRAAKKETMTEEQIADIILDSFRHIAYSGIGYHTKPIYSDLWKTYNISYKNSTDNGDMT